ncbi:MAG: hypothetical protein H0U04_04375 [Rubrobacter sp.]|nr:hypothetical protein [Rubrobacter sp.]
MRRHDHHRHEAGQCLVNCPNQGIIIGADDTPLDLNDHTVDGNGSL